MAKVRPFICVRPEADKADKIAALPYDVYNREEAKEVVKNNPKSFLAIDRAETQFSDDVDTYDARVYEKAASMLKEWIEDGSFIRDEVKGYYIYDLNQKIDAVLAAFYQNICDTICIVGVCGSNGKSSVVSFLYEMMEAEKCMCIGTQFVKIANKTIQTQNTTPAE